MSSTEFAFYHVIYRKTSTIFYQNKGSLELITLIQLCNSNISGQNANVYKKFFLHQISKAIISSKTFGKVIEISIENVKNCCKEKKL